MNETKFQNTELGGWAIGCTRHRTQLPLPCPYPKCENGPRGNPGIVIDKLIPDMLTRMDRVSWKSPSGAYYSWHRRGWPHLLDAGLVIEECLNRAGLGFDIPNDAILYHYATAAQLIDIVQLRGVPLTHCATQSDPSEVTSGLEEVRRIVDDCYRERPFVVDLASKFMTRAEPLDAYLAMYHRNGDSVPHWQQGADVAVGFKFGGFRGIPYGLLLNTVCYDVRRTRQSVDVVMNHVRQAAERDQHEIGKEVLSAYYSFVDMQLTVLGAFLKHASYAHQQAAKLLHLPKESLGHPPKKLPHFKAVGDSISAFMHPADVPGHPGPHAPISEIVLAPRHSGATAVEAGIRHLLASISCESVIIRRSTSPLR